MQSHSVYWSSCSSRISALFIIVNVVQFVCNDHRLRFLFINCYFPFGLDFVSCWIFIVIDFCIGAIVWGGSAKIFCMSPPMLSSSHMSYTGSLTLLWILRLRCSHASSSSSLLGKWSAS